jgi:membrane protease YdiL (CAAX protease family)
MSQVADGIEKRKVAGIVPASLPGSRAAESYWELSRRPLVSLAFIAPILLAYELGVLTLGSGQPRNAADVWLRQLLGALGFGQYLLLPLLTCGVLLGWHHVRNDPWRIRPRVLGVMWLEALVLGVALLAFANVLGSWMPALDATNIQRSSWSKLIGYLGAGCYEELLFRLLLLSGIALAAKQAGLNRRGSLIAAVGISSVAFAAVHYRFELSLFGWSLGPAYGDSFTLYSFLFRTAAGVFFGCLFVVRGFGIVVGAHALYDVLVLLVELVS